MMARRRKNGALSSRVEAQEEEKEEVEEEQDAPVEHVEPRRKASPRRQESSWEVSEEQGRAERRQLAPLAAARLSLQTVHGHTDKIIVGLSGGKDSLVTLDLCVREFGASNVHAFFMYFVKGLRCVETIIRWCERRYKIEVDYFPHWTLGLAYKYAIYMPHRTGTDQWRDMKQVDVENAARQKTGAEWLAMGHRMTDSIERVAMLKGIAGIDTVGRRVYPLWRWNEAAVVAYMRMKKLPRPPKLTILKRSMSGVSFEEDTLLFLRDHFPDDYAKILKVFPYADAKLARFEMKKKSWKQDTVIDKFKTSLKGR